ncbi:MAG TPA: hypothetical protein PKE30_16665, partial [Niabella sp.]|nr:hypothetical protein [Niabella sp.]
INEDTGDGKWWKWSDNARGVKRVGWSQYANPMDGLTYWSKISGKNRMILDPDFLRINTFANKEEKKSVMTACIISGGAVTVSDRYNTIGDDLWVYQNKELLALREDGFVGKPLTNDPTKEESQVWKGQLSNGDWIVAFFNRENTYQSRGKLFSDLLIQDKAKVRDLWKHEDLGVMSSFSVRVPPHGVVVIRISKTT